MATQAQTIARVTSKDPAAKEALMLRMAPEINSHYWECFNSTKSALSHAIAAGNELAKVKKSLPHGQWLKFIEDHLDFSVDRAQEFMKIAAKLPSAIKQAGVDAAEIASVKGALKLISQTNKSQKPAPAGISGEPANSIDGILEAEPACIHEYDADGVCMKCQKDFVPAVAENDKEALLKDVDRGIAAFKVLLRGVDALARLSDQKSWGKVVVHKLTEMHNQFQVLRKNCQCQKSTKSEELSAG